MAGIEAELPTTIIDRFVVLFAGSEALLFTAQAEVLERPLTESDFLAHWTYAQQDVKEEIEKAVHADARASWKHLAWISLGTLGVGLLATLRVSARHRFKDVFFYLGASGVLALLVPAAVLLVQRTRAARSRRANPLRAAVADLERLSRAACWRRAVPEAFVGRDAAYVLGELHTWRLYGARARLALVTDEDKPSLRVDYLLPRPARRLGEGLTLEGHIRTVLIPIPPGEEERARAAALAIMGSTSPGQPSRAEG